ncbi:MAG: dihydropteroate synthase, partial [Elusimicrobia bacterium]|nr:dihydropteroate synthase [Elusimicrobiota bacterium]
MTLNDLLNSDRPLIMGVLNVTPDSFFDGGKYNLLDNALNHSQEMVAQGADIIDIGGESTRPGAEAVDENEEIKRIVPVIERIAKQFK